MLLFQIAQRLQAVFALQPLKSRPGLAKLGIQRRSGRVGNLAGRIIRNCGIFHQGIQGVFFAKVFEGLVDICNGQSGLNWFS